MLLITLDKKWRNLVKISKKMFFEVFREAWGDDRGEGERRSDYDKQAWSYVQTKVDNYFEKKEKTND